MVYDGDSNTSPMIGKYCGDTIPPNSISSSNNLFMNFKTDQYATNTGFYLEYNVLHPVLLWMYLNK